MQNCIFTASVVGTHVAVSEDLLRRNKMIANVQTTNALFENRNKTVAKSFYRQLKSEGFSHEQIINLSTTLLALVSEDLKVFEEAS